MREPFDIRFIDPVPLDMMVLGFAIDLPPRAEDNCAGIITARPQRPFRPLRFMVDPGSAMSEIVSLYVGHDEILRVATGESMAGSLFPPERHNPDDPIRNVLPKTCPVGMEIRLVVFSRVIYFPLRFRASILGEVIPY